MSGMNFHHWSSLFRGYDLSLRYNRWLLALTAAGAATGLLLGTGTAAERLFQGLTGAAAVFGAGALAKELVPDRLVAAVAAALFAIPFATAVSPAGLLALFWLLGSMRFLNRTTGLRPRLSDTLVVLFAAALLIWRVSPLFGLLAGIMLLLDVLLPDGQRAYLAPGVLAVGVAGWMLVAGKQKPEPLPLLYTTIVLIIATGFIPIILNSFQITVVGDATGAPLYPVRIQAAQAFALSSGLFLASGLGRPGILILSGLWAGLAGVLAHHIMTLRSRRSVPSI